MSSRMKFSYAAVSLLAILHLGPVSNLYADAFDIYGLSAARTGMSGAGAALSDDWTSVYYNQAGLSSPMQKCNPPTKESIVKSQRSERGDIIEPAHCPLNSFGFTVAYFHQWLGIQPANSGSYQDTLISDSLKDLNTTRVNLGFNIDLRSFVEIPFDIPVNIGFALGFDADGTLVKVNDLNEEKFDFFRADSNNRFVSATLAVSAQVWKNRLSIGFSPGNKSYIRGAVKVSNLNLNSDNPPHTQVLFDAQTKLAPQGALLYRQPVQFFGKNDNLLVGFVFRYRLESDSNINLNASLPFGYAVQSAISQSAILAPDMYEFSTAYVHGKIKGTLDLDYQRWSELQVLHPYQAALDFNDILIPRIGGELPLQLLLPGIFSTDKTRLRTGYALVSAITPNQDGQSNRLDNTKHLISLGITALIPKNFIMLHETQVDFSVQWQIWQDRSATKGQSYFADGSQQQSYHYFGNALLLDLTLTWRM